MSTARFGWLRMPDSIITPEALARCAGTPVDEQLRRIRAVELALLQKRVKILRQQLNHDQSDVETAFDADRLMPGPTHMVVCPVCSNKRCPKAADPDNACTGSNAPGQVGSAYP